MRSLSSLLPFASVHRPRTHSSRGVMASVKLAEPTGEARGVVIYFSGRKGLSKADDAAAQAIAKGGALVAEIDSQEYLRRLDKLKEKCHWLVYDTELLTRQLERERRLPTYLTPIVAGVGEGGTLAAIELGPGSRGHNCGCRVDRSRGDNRQQAADLFRPAHDGAQRRIQLRCSEKITRLLDSRIDAPRPRSGSRIHHEAASRRRADRSARDASKRGMGDALRSLIEPHLAKPGPAVTKIPTNSAPTVDISALPLTELPVDQPSKLMAILLSGDGGWRDLDKTIAEDLQQQGIPVVGFDTLRYFWSKKTPQQTADVVAALIQTFMTKWHADKVALIGYSFGADVMPFAYNLLPPSLRDHVVLISLLGLSKSADFEISVRGWLGRTARIRRPSSVAASNKNSAASDPMLLRRGRDRYCLSSACAARRRNVPQEWRSSL